MGDMTDMILETGWEEDHEDYVNDLWEKAHRNPPMYDSQGYRQGITPDCIYAVMIKFNGTGIPYTFLLYGKHDSVKLSRTKRYNQTLLNGRSQSDMIVHQVLQGTEAMRQLSDIYEKYGKITMFRPESAPSYWRADMAASDVMEYIHKYFKTPQLDFIEIW